ncbi:TIGR01777 family protein [Nocardioides seonyuensis]|uniref:TIGR01777 family protein n=1 Tax=Nocardioides seonyuensis TaxID=2518371 RepID=A0A4V1BML5_9ACTN|nr:TIGR01777 family oxidoreductase [Nocardioides seonyuensis]QBX56792.1 TIGR01777 family protein [Nocardioides seonyuensis]
MRVLIAGASGFLGTHLSEHLRVHGHEVVHLVRRPAESPQESQWDPAAGRVQPSVVEDADAVVNLAGASIAGNPHSKRWAREVRDSRVDTTALLAQTIAACERPPAFLAGNGISYYGDHGAYELTEDSESLGDALLTRVTRDWEAATEPARDAGARVCVLRTAPVMDRGSSPLRQLRLLFSLGLGARLGDGEQYMPMISLRDWVGAVAFLLESHDLSGPFNLCCPQTPTNSEFTRALASALRRPAMLAAPTAVLRPALGRMAPEILGSVRVRPAALERAGYDFEDEDVDDVLAAALA